MTGAVAGACFLVLVGVAVDYAVHNSSDPTDATTTAPTTGPEPTPTDTIATPSPITTPGAVAAPTRPSLPATLVPRVPHDRRRAKQARATPEPTSGPTAEPTPTPPPTLDFTLTTFNVLGASHTAARGNKSGRPSGAERARGAATLLKRHGSDVVGFQELQTSQLAVLAKRTDLDFYPGRQLGRLDSENSLGWQRSEWTAVEKHIVRIPYFAGGLRAMPVVLLRNRATGLEAWFINVHNPAETARFHHQQRFRVASTDIEIALTNELITKTGLPVFLTGDMNERAPFYCRYTSGAPMIAARGGTNQGTCRPGRPRAVDWIFGSRDVAFSGYDEDRSHLVDITTDHPVVSTEVRITGTARNPGLAGSSSSPGTGD